MIARPYFFLTIITIYPKMILMRVDKREILRKLVRGDLWEKLSAKEIRLYLLLIIATDKKKGAGKLSWEEISYYLGPGFTWNELKEIVSNLQKLCLVEFNYEGRNINFKL